MTHNKISTLTCSYDPYNFLFQDYDKLFRKYWKLDTHNILVGDPSTTLQKPKIGRDLPHLRS